MSSVLSGLNTRYPLATGLALACALVVALSIQKRQLVERVDLLVKESQTVPVGEYVPVFDGITVDGQTVRIGESSAGQVLYLLSTTCDYCRQSLAAWEQAGRTIGESLRVPHLGLAIDTSAITLRRFVKAFGMEYPVVAFPDERSRALYRAHRVPQTIVLADDGRVVYTRLGVVTATAVDSIVTAVRRMAEGGS